MNNYEQEIKAINSRFSDVTLRMIICLIKSHELSYLFEFKNFRI